MTTDQQRLEDDVERARAQLGDTVAALAAKADVKQHARDAAGRVRSGAPAVARRGAVAAGAALAVSVAVLAWRRRDFSAREWAARMPGARILGARGRTGLGRWVSGRAVRGRSARSRGVRGRAARARGARDRSYARRLLQKR